jgi:hypothetical protein
MPATLTYPARSSGDQTTNYLRAPITYTSGATSVVKVGTLPAGCVVLRSYVIITTAFNAGTANAATIGISGAAAAYGTAATILLGTVGVIVGSPTAGSTATATAPSVDTPVILTMAQTGTAATAGAGFVVVEYCPVA